MASCVLRLHYSAGIDRVVGAALETSAHAAPGTTNCTPTSLAYSFLNIRKYHERRYKIRKRKCKFLVCTSSFLFCINFMFSVLRYRSWTSRPVEPARWHCGQCRSRRTWSDESRDPDPTATTPHR